MKAPVILATDNRLFTAAVSTRGQRLLEVLNDHMTEFVIVNDFRSYADGAVEEGTHTSAVLRKANLALAILATSHEAAERRMHYFVSKRQYPCAVVVGDYLVEGNLYLRGSPDLTAILNTELQSFFPMTDAVVSRAEGPVSADHSVVLVNKNKVAALQIGEAVVSQPRALEPMRG